MKCATQVKKKKKKNLKIINPHYFNNFPTKPAEKFVTL